MDFERFSDLFQKIQERIDEILEGYPESLYAASRHLTRAGGKRIRPLLCILSCESVGGATDDSLDTAVALELIHTFTLIHDDIMDHDELRRGSPSVHKVYGESTAILAGDLLFSKAFEMADPRTIKILAKASAEICEGQELDMSFEDKKAVSEQEYSEMIRKKTAVLLQAATESGALIGHGSREMIASLADYGTKVGMAFQIHDDVLDVVADEAELGKPVGSDIAEGKMSLIAIKALEFLQGDKKERLQEILDGRDNTPSEISEAKKLFEESRAIEYCQKKAEDYIMNAKKSLLTLPESPARKTLEEFAEFVIERKK